MTEKAEHTPGEWNAGTNPDESVFINANDGSPVAFAYARKSTAEQEANARLISAAPDMLELISEFQEALFNGPENLSWSRSDELLDKANQIKSAMAKARGEERE